MPLTGVISPERALLEFVGAAAAVTSTTTGLHWCTQAWSEAADSAGGTSAEVLAELACARLEKRGAVAEGIVTCDLQVGESDPIRLAAQPLDQQQWLIVLRDKPGANGGRGACGVDRGEAEASTLDEVTGLPDRAALTPRLTERFRRPEPFALLFIDLDGFKQVNDTRGHLVGDQALNQAAQRMRSSIREHDFIARFGGDEFVVIVEGVDLPQALEPLLKRLRHSLQSPLSLGSEPLHVSASIGAALSIDGYASVEAMLHAADSRMYASRRAVSG